MDRREHGGDIYRNQVRYDASVNVNPLGMPGRVREKLLRALDTWSRYPDPECQALNRALAAFYGLEESRILCGNGAAELIWLLVQQLRPRKALLVEPTFSEYESALLSAGCQAERIFLTPENGFLPDMDRIAEAAAKGCDMVFFCNPNNPTGVLASRKDMKILADACERRGAYLVVDECFCELSDDPEGASMVPEISCYSKLILLKAFTKTYAMAGLRLGYLLAGDDSLPGRLRRNRQPWSVSVPAQAAGIAALEEADYLEESRRLIRKERAVLAEGLETLGLKVFSSCSNFLLFAVPDEEKRCRRQDALWVNAGQRGLLIRNCENFAGLGPGYYRVCVGRPEENRFLLKTIGQSLTET